jgi:hypothetical protein
MKPTTKPNEPTATAMRGDAPEPLCDEAEFATLVRELVVDTAPRMFALVEEEGERADAWAYAWGLEFGDHVAVVVPHERMARRYDSATEAHETMSHRRKLRLVWCPSPAPTAKAA